MLSHEMLSLPLIRRPFIWYASSGLGYGAVALSKHVGNRPLSEETQNKGTIDLRPRHLHKSSASMFSLFFKQQEPELCHPRRGIHVAAVLLHLASSLTDSAVQYAKIDRVFWDYGISTRVLLASSRLQAELVNHQTHFCRKLWKGTGHLRMMCAALLLRVDVPWIQAANQKNFVNLLMRRGKPPKFHSPLETPVAPT